jgi:MFS family permease
LRFGAEHDRGVSVQPPPLVALQLFNALIAFGSILLLMLGTTWWTTWEWSAFSIGVVTTLANLCYGIFVTLGGRLADRWGRARSGILGSSIGLAGCVYVVMSDHPAATVVAAMAGMLGAALFFPGSAGLFSDAEGAAGGPPPLLHRKIRRYNMGWAAGNLSAFFVFGILDDAPRMVGYGIAAASFALVAIGLWRYRNVPQCVAMVAPDRSAHAALPILTLMYRVNLFIACVMCMALITQIQKGLSFRMPIKDATDLASITLMCYSGCYLLMFIALGSWTGWILRPWALYWCQIGFLFGGASLMAVAFMGWFSPWLLALSGGLIGSGFGATYVGSIYYSLRLPAGVGRAAALHETFLGLGNTMGPLLAGSFMSFLLGGIKGLSVFIAFSALLSVIWQIILIPKATKL